jgi:hypothetical protein
MDFQEMLEEAKDAVEELFSEAQMEGDADHDEATKVMWRRRADALGDALDKLKGIV